MKTTCSNCGAQNGLLRVLLYWTGLHVRCRACGQVFRVLETPGAVFAVFGVFGAVYLLAFWAISFVWPPDGLDTELGALLFAGLPAAPAAAAAILATGWLHRLGPPDPEVVPRLGPVGFLGVYLTATLAVAALVAVIAFGILVTRYGEALPQPVFAREAVLVAVPAEQAEELVFVDLVGTPRSLAGLRGSVVLFHLFDPDTRGTPAVLETLRQLRREVRDQGVLFAVVAECTRDRLAMFVDRGAPSLPYTYLDGALPDAMRTLGEVRPATFVVNSAGAVVFVHGGRANWATEAAIAFLNGLAGETDGR